MPPREVPCPSCGAPVKFASIVSVLAVCGYCRASLLRRDLERIGTMAAVLDEASPIQLGAEGRYRGSHFAVVGRVQVRYEDGAWSEWHVVFDDGRSGWLADAGGAYAISFAVEVPGPVPPGKRSAPASSSRWPASPTR